MASGPHLLLLTGALAIPLFKHPKDISSLFWGGWHSQVVFQLDWTGLPGRIPGLLPHCYLLLGPQEVLVSSQLLPELE